MVQFLLVQFVVWCYSSSFGGTIRGLVVKFVVWWYNFWWYNSWFGDTIRGLVVQFGVWWYNFWWYSSWFGGTIFGGTVSGLVDRLRGEVRRKMKKCVKGRTNPTTIVKWNWLLSVA